MFGSALFNRCKAPQPLVALSESARRDEDIRIGCWDLQHLPSLNFYLKRNVEHLQDERAVASFLKSSLPVYVFLPLDAWQQMAPTINTPVRVLGQGHDMYHHVAVVVVTNR